MRVATKFRIRDGRSQGGDRRRRRGPCVGGRVEIRAGGSPDIAILIGIAAAGIGMQAGHKGYSAMGGVIAAGMTIVAIYTAKFVVLQLILSGLGYHSMSEIDSSKLARYFFSPIGLIITCVGVAAAFRTANGTSRD